MGTWALERTLHLQHQHLQSQQRGMHRAGRKSVLGWGESSSCWPKDGCCQPISGFLFRIAVQMRKKQDLILYPSQPAHPLPIQSHPVRWHTQQDGSLAWILSPGLLWVPEVTIVQQMRSLADELHPVALVWTHNMHL